MSIIIYSKLVEIIFISFFYVPYKGLPSINDILRMHRFFLILSSHIFTWTCGSSKNFLFNCLSNNCHSILIINGFQPNLYQHFSHVCSVYLSYYFQSEVVTCNLDPWQMIYINFQLHNLYYIDVSFCTESLKKVVGLSFSQLYFKVRSICLYTSTKQ